MIEQNYFKFNKVSMYIGGQSMWLQLMGSKIGLWDAIEKNFTSFFCSLNETFSIVFDVWLIFWLKIDDSEGLQTV